MEVLRMREIKFRVWDSERKRMSLPFKLDGFTIFFTDDTIPFQFLSDTNRFKIMQYVEFSDKNGKEIYEGDILRTTVIFAWDLYLDNDIEETEVITTVVEYRPPKFTQRRVDDGLLYTFDMEDFEVIGNIYENPEGVESDTIY